MNDLARILSVGACLAFASCVNAPTELELVAPDRSAFAQDVYPVLLRDCGFHACHGTTERFFQVFGPGRGRLGLDVMPLDPMTSAELDHSYERARSMIDARSLDQSVLLRKPLAAEAGGSGHEGADDLGRNVYQTKLDPGYSALARWVHGSAAFPAGQ